MKQTTIKVSLTLIFGLCTMTTQAATLNTGDRLTINSGITSYDANGNVTNVVGSWFGCDCNGNSSIENSEKTALHQGTEGIIIGVIQGPGSPTHSGTPLASDWNRITAPYSFFGNTAEEYTTSPITGGTGGLNFSGFNWPWNGIASIPFGSGAWGAGFSNGMANFVWDSIYGHGYALDYHTTVPAGDPSGLGGIRFAYHLEGTVQAVPLPAASWLLGSGLLGLIGVASRHKSRHQA